MGILPEIKYVRCVDCRLSRYVDGLACFCLEKRVKKICGIRRVCFNFVKRRGGRGL